MSQTGVYGTDSRRAARRSGASGSDTQESLSSGPMAYISGKQAFLQILRQEGVSVMFGNPGTTELPLMDGLAREPGIHYVLALQEDVLNAERDLELGAPTRVARRMVGDRAAVAQAAALLARAERPLLVAGDAVTHGDALAELVELAELVGAPVMAEGVASTCSFPFTHPLYSGSMPRLGPPIRALLMRHDLLFSVGGDLFTLSLPDDVDPMPPGLTVVHLDVDPWELGKNYPAAVAIQGDPKATLPELSEAVRRITGKQGHPDAVNRTAAVRAAWERERTALAQRAEADATRVPLAPLTLVHDLARCTPANAVIVDESISSSQGVRHFFRCADRKSFFGLRGGGIGWGLPAALGVTLALRGPYLIDGRIDPSFT